MHLSIVCPEVRAPRTETERAGQQLKKRGLAVATAPLRVVHVVLSMDVGGMERGLVNQIREALILKESVLVMCLEREGTLAPQLHAMGVPTVCFQKQPGIRLGMIKKIQRLLRRLRPDVVHTHQIGTLLYAGPAARLAGVPVVVHTEHGKRYDSGLRTRMLGRSAGLFADRFFCLSQDIASELALFGITARHKIRVIPNGIDLTRFQSEGSKEGFREECGLPAGVPTVGTIGRMVAVKRQDMLIRSFAEVRRRFPEAHLVLVGDGPLVGELRVLSARLGLSHCTHFAGYQSQPERYLRAMDVFALTSQSEGMPQVIMEAAAAGVPVIATRVGGVPEMIEHGESGLLVACGDEAALTAGLCDLLANQELAQRLSQAAKASVATQFDVRRMAADYHRQLSELLSPKPGLRAV